MTPFPDDHADESAPEQPEGDVVDAREPLRDEASEPSDPTEQLQEEVAEIPDLTEQLEDEAPEAPATIDELADPGVDTTPAEAPDRVETMEELERAESEGAIEEPTPEPIEEPIPEPVPEPAVEAAPEPITEAEREDELEVVEASGHDPFRGPGDWYVVHTYAGYENKVKTNLESRIHTMQMEDKIFIVHIPMEDVMEIKGGKKQVVQRKVFPGYLLVKMIYDNDSWYVVRNTPGVTGFVAAGTGSKPTPLSRREVEKILVVKKEEVKPQFRLGFEENDVVRIISGPFADFNGTISEINLDQSKLKVLVNIFDRETPVELSFDQVAKV